MDTGLMDAQPPALTRRLLARDLRYVAQALVAGTLKDVPGWGCRNQPEYLEATVGFLRPKLYVEEPRLALEEVLAEAIDRLGNERMPHRAVRFKDIAERSFGLLDTDVAHLDGKKYDNLVRRLALSAGIAATNQSERYAFMRVVRERVADKLIELIAQQAGTSPETKSRSAPKPPNIAPVASIERKQLQAAADALLYGGRPVVLWGESGNGKTFLARQLADRFFNGKRVALLRGVPGANSPFFASDTVRALKLGGYSPESWSAAAAMEALEEMLARGDCLDLVIFDDADEDTAKRYLSRSSTPSLVTSRTRLAWSECTFVRVREFTPKDALSLCEQVLPDTPRPDLELLCLNLGHRPLAIDIALRVLQRGLNSVESLNLACQESVPDSIIASMQLLDEKITNSIIQVYRRALEQISSQGSARRVLDTIIWLTGSNIKAIVRALSEEQKPSELMTLTFAAELNALDASGLIDVQGDDLVVNSLTIDILRALTPQDSINVLEGFYDRCISPAVEAADWLNSNEEASWYDLMNRIIGDLNDRSRSEFLRRLFALEAAGIAGLVEELCPNARIGLVCISEHLWVLWQENTEWFTTPSGAPDVALIQTGAQDFRFWANGRNLAGFLSKDAVTLMAALSTLFKTMADELFHILSSSTPPKVGPDLWTSSPSVTMHQSHLLVSVVPKIAAADLGLFVWAQCGVRYRPRRLQAGEWKAITQCAECESGDTVKTNPEEWTRVLSALAELVRFGHDLSGWEDRAVIYSTMGLLLADPGSAVVNFDLGVAATRESSERDHGKALAYRACMLAAMHWPLIALGELTRARLASAEFCSLMKDPDLSMEATSRFEIWSQVLDPWNATNIRDDQLKVALAAYDDLRDDLEGIVHLEPQITTLKRRIGALSPPPQGSCPPPLLGLYPLRHRPRIDQRTT
jgi:hypothetical protein